jgi:hypothetical protein
VFEDRLNDSVRLGHACMHACSSLVDNLYVTGIVPNFIHSVCKAEKASVIAGSKSSEGEAKSWAKAVTSLR